MISEIEKAAASLSTHLFANQPDLGCIVINKDSLHVYIRSLTWHDDRPNTWNGFKVYWNLGVWNLGVS